METDYQHICLFCGEITELPIFTDIGVFCCFNCEQSYNIAYSNWLEAKGLL